MRCQIIKSRIDHNMGKSLTIERFWPASGKEIILHDTGDKAVIDFALCGYPAAIVKRLVEMGAHIIIHQRVARPRIKSQNIALLFCFRANIGQIGNTADIDYHRRTSIIHLDVHLGDKRGMINRCQWRTLPASRHIGAAYIMHNID